MTTGWSEDPSEACAESAPADHADQALVEKPAPEGIAGRAGADDLPDLTANVAAARAHVRQAVRAIIAIGRLSAPWEDRRIRALFCCLDALEALRQEHEALLEAHWRRLLQMQPRAAQGPPQGGSGHLAALARALRQAPRAWKSLVQKAPGVRRPKLRHRPPAETDGS